MTAVSGTTRLLGLLGRPVAHSLSPRLHMAAYAARGIDAVYLALPVEPASLGAAVAGLRAVGTLGANVTVPHKQAVVAHCTTVSEEARLVGAVNTLVLDDDGVHGDNTDALGLEAALAHDVGALEDVGAVVVGAGGAARAAVVALVRAGARVTVAARRATAGDELARVLGDALGADVASSGLDGARVLDDVRAARVVVNATPVGLHDEPMPEVVRTLDAGQVAYDLLYRPTPWQADAEARGAGAFDGARMLVEQAARSHARWFGGEPPVAAMLAALGPARADPARADPARADPA